MWDGMGQGGGERRVSHKVYYLLVLGRVAAAKIKPDAFRRIVNTLQHKRQRRAVQVAPGRLVAQSSDVVKVIRVALGRIERTELVAPLKRDGHIVLVLDKGAEVIHAERVALDVAEDVGGRGRGGGGRGASGGGGEDRGGGKSGPGSCAMAAV